MARNPQPAERKQLTAKEKRFVEEYAASNGNAVQAYLSAYGRHTAREARRSYRAAQVAASRLLSKDIIRQEIAAAQAEYAARLRVSRLRVLQEVAALAFSDPGDVYEPDAAAGGLPRPKPWADIRPAARRAIQAVKVKRRRLKGGGGKSDTTEWEVEELEYKFHPKGPELDKLCKKLGFYRDEPAPPPGAGSQVRVTIPDNGRGDGPDPAPDAVPAAE